MPNILYILFGAWHGVNAALVGETLRPRQVASTPTPTPSSTPGISQTVGTTVRTTSSSSSTSSSQATIGWFSDGENNAITTWSAATFDLRTDFTIVESNSFFSFCDLSTSRLTSSSVIGGSITTLSTLSFFQTSASSDPCVAWTECSQGTLLGSAFSSSTCKTSSHCVSLTLFSSYGDGKVAQTETGSTAYGCDSDSTTAMILFKRSPASTGLPPLMTGKLNATSSSTSISPPPLPSTQSLRPSSSSLSNGAIAGTVIGAVAFALLFPITFWVLRNRRKKAALKMSDQALESAAAVVQSDVGTEATGKSPKEMPNDERKREELPNSLENQVLEVPGAVPEMLGDVPVHELPATK